MPDRDGFNTSDPRLRPDDPRLKQARLRFRQSADAETETRRDMLDDQLFMSKRGEQWPDALRREREKDGRPCLEMDRTSQFVHQIVNEVRKSKPSPKVSGVDSGSDPETAEVIQGIYRHIERQSNADMARSWAVSHSIPYGRGWYRVGTKYAEDGSFDDQDITIQRIKYQSSVYHDVSAEEPDYSDGRYAFIVQDLPTEDYKDKYGDSKIASLSDWSTIGNQAPGWITESSVRIAEYFDVQEKKDQWCLLADGSCAYESDLHPRAEVLRSRPKTKRQVKWSLINGVEVLEEQDLPGMWIPLVPILGEELVVDGATFLRGMVSLMKDAQRQFNYMRSAQVEAIGLAPRAPFMAPVGSTEDFPEWATANSRNHAVLRYKPIQTSNGDVLAAPSRQVFEPAIAAITQAAQWASEDMMASVGMYQSSLGQKSNEKSGKAILARDAQAETATYHLVSAVSIGVLHEFRIVNDLIPKIYDRPGRVQRILGEDGTEKRVMLGPKQQAQQAQLPPGVENIYDLSTGKYDISVSVGPGWDTKRQESSETLIQLAQNMPALVERAPDLIIRNLDIAGADEIADRIRPPDIEDGKQDPAQLQATLNTVLQQHEALTQTVHNLQDVIDSKKLELDSRERIAAMQEVTKRTIALAQINSSEAALLLEQEIATINQRTQMQHEAGMKQADQEHQAGMADLQHQQGMEAQQAAAEAEPSEQ